MNKGTLYLIPVPLAMNAADASFTPYLRQIINHIDEYIVENEKAARRFLKEAGLSTPQRDLKFHDYGKHSRNESNVSAYFDGLIQGRDVGLMSEAGCPAIADPGARIVGYAHKLGIRVRPLVGPNSIILALMASGFSGQSFAFHGYLPIPKTERSQRIKHLEQVAKKKQQTQIFIETPFRNHVLLEHIIRNCQDQTQLCVACDITGPNELIISRPIKYWKEMTIDIHKRPAIFLLY